MSNRNKKIVLSVLVLSLAVAVYLNWQFPNEDFKSSEVLKYESEEKNLGDTKLVSGTTTNPNIDDKSTDKKEDSEKETDDKKSAEATTTESKESTNNSKDNKKIEYFDDARETRGKARDEALAILREIADDIKADGKDKSKAIEKITVIAENVECEANIENLIKAKGYDDSVAIINGDEITIVVKEKELSSAQLAELQEIAISSGRAKSDKIKIITAK